MIGLLPPPDHEAMPAPTRVEGRVLSKMSRGYYGKGYVGCHRCGVTWAAAEGRACWICSRQDATTFVQGSMYCNLWPGTPVRYY